MEKNHEMAREELVEEIEDLDERDEAVDEHKNETDSEQLDPNVEIDIFFEDRIEVLVNQGTFGSRSIINLPKPLPKGPEEAE